MFMQNFSSPDGLRQIFEKKSRIFPNLSMQLSSEPMHVHAKFQISNLYPDGLGQIFDLFSRKIQDFLKENLEFSKSEKSSD
jgi:hypothetical protein